LLKNFLRYLLARQYYSYFNDLIGSNFAAFIAGKIDTIIVINIEHSAIRIIDEIFTNPDDKMNIGINYSQGDKFAASSLLNRDRIGLTLNSEISDRILINGKIGVPVSGTEENVILGNVQIEFLLNDAGNLKARIFNKENEYQFFGDEIGYTQGFGISYDVEFDSFSELISKIRKKNKEK